MHLKIEIRPRSLRSQINNLLPKFGFPHKHCFSKSLGGEKVCICCCQHLKPGSFYIKVKFLDLLEKLQELTTLGSHYQNSHHCWTEAGEVTLCRQDQYSSSHWLWSPCTVPSSHVYLPIKPLEASEFESVHYIHGHMYICIYISLYMLYLLLALPGISKSLFLSLSITISL